MSDFEAFSGADAGAEGSDPAAFERFKERMKAASAGLAAAQAGEQKARKKEDELIKILLKFIKSNQKHDQLMLVVRLLEENIPASFIVSLLLISNKAIQEELGIKLLAHETESGQTGANQNTAHGTLPTAHFKEETLPPRIKNAIDSWLSEIAKRASENPDKILETVKDKEGTIKLPVIQLTVFSLRDFLESEGSPTDYDKLKEFITLMLEKILNKSPLLVDKKTPKEN